MSTDPNHPAFPQDGRTTSACYKGVTKREYFAGQAMALLLTRARFRPEAVAVAAYQYADAMCGSQPVAETLTALRDRMQVRHDVIKPLIIMGDDDSINLTPHQQGMQYAFAEVVKAIDELLK